MPRPPPPPPCVKRLAFGLSEFTTDGCFTNTAFQPKRWETTAAIKLNGISFPDYGQRFEITEPTASEPGGHFYDHARGDPGRQADRVLGPHRLGRCPTAKQGEEEAVRCLAVPSFARLFGLKVLGSIDLRIGRASDGKYYATFPLNVEFPSTFRAGPGTRGRHRHR